VRKCSDCKIEKEEKEFYKAKIYEDNIDKICKICRCENALQYRRTFKGLMTEIYSHQKISSPQRGLGDVCYSKAQLIEWCESSDKFMKMFNQWEIGDYFIDLRPTIDRIENGKGYTFSNIQAMTYRDNINKENEDRKKGKSRALKRVMQYEKDGIIFIKEFFSIIEASRETGSNQSHIGSVCSGKRKTHNGSVWKFK